MDVVATVQSLWRYPVKSMAGEKLESAYIGFAGVYGDRIYAFTSPSGPAGFPWVTGRQQRAMLLYRPSFRHPAEAEAPPNLAEAEKLAPGATPQYATPDKLAVDIRTPSGETLGIDDPALLAMLRESLGDDSDIRLLRSDRSMTDCRPVSLFSIQSVRQLGQEIGTDLDARRFRANIYLDLGSASGFAEDELVGRTVRIGSKATLSVLERDPRCKMISIDPDTAEQTPEVLKQVSRAHEGKVGIYGAVLVEGTVHPGDTVRLLD